MGHAFPSGTRVDKTREEWRGRVGEGSRGGRWLQKGLTYLDQQSEVLIMSIELENNYFRRYVTLIETTRSALQFLIPLRQKTRNAFQQIRYVWINIIDVSYLMSLNARRDGIGISLWLSDVCRVITKWRITLPRLIGSSPWENDTENNRKHAININEVILHTCI